jgi:hypothetical protein
MPEYVSAFCRKLKNFLRNLNLFPSVPPTTDQYELQNQKISTRIFIILLTLILTLLLLYTSLVRVTKTVNVKTPNLAQYSQLYASHSQTLTCACTKVSVEYEKFVHVNYTLHQVCNSIFVSSNWTDYLGTFYDNYFVYSDDFRWTATQSFITLSGFCDSMVETISANLIQFYSSQYVSASVTPLELFQSQAQSSVLQFISSTTNGFLSSLNLIRSTTQGNALLSGLLSNFVTDVPADNPDIYTYPEEYSGCNCQSSATCVEDSTFLDFPDYTVLFTVPGFYTGCYAVEALLQSTLQCFYNQTCIDQLLLYLGSPSSMNITALQSSMPSRYFENSTIQDLLDQLMVEQWNSSSIYDNYYDECQPAQCIYTYQTRNDLIYIITTLIGLVGGLITVLKLVVPRVVTFVRRKFVLPRPEIGKIKGKRFYNDLKRNMCVLIHIHIVYGWSEVVRF